MFVKIRSLSWRPPKTVLSGGGGGGGGVASTLNVRRLWERREERDGQEDEKTSCVYDV